MPDLMVEDYRKYFLLGTEAEFEKARNLENANANALFRGSVLGPVIP